MKLLILACSATKRQGTHKAINLYDGPMYRVLRKWLHKDIKVIILSAKYGLLSSESIISFYEQKITESRAKELQPDITEELNRLAESTRFSEVLIEVGSVYKIALPSIEILTELFRCPIVFDSGRIGERLSHLKLWLRNIPKIRAHRLVHATTVCNLGTGYLRDTYSKLALHPSGIPTHLLLSFYYLHKYKERAYSILEAYKKCTNNGKIYIDSGIFTFMSKYKQGNTTLSFEFLKKYTLKYIEFLNNTMNLWDIAIDVDADIVIGCDQTDILHELILENINFPPQVLMRVYHSVRQNIEEWWNNICIDTRYRWLGIEFIEHNWNPQFYRPLIDIAHRYGKKVHALGATSIKFASNVPADSFDSSSHLLGPRTGIVFLPFGNVYFSKKLCKNHYTTLSSQEQNRVNSFVAIYGMNVKDLTQYANRALFNIWVMNDYWDIPFTETTRHPDLFDGDLYFEE